jgi:hypothetical protein
VKGEGRTTKELAFFWIFNLVSPIKTAETWDGGDDVTDFLNCSFDVNIWF